MVRSINTYISFHQHIRFRPSKNVPAHQKNVSVPQDICFSLWNNMFQYIKNLFQSMKNMFQSIKGYDSVHQQKCLSPSNKYVSVFGPSNHMFQSIKNMFQSFKNICFGPSKHLHFSPSKICVSTSNRDVSVHKKISPSKICFSPSKTTCFSLLQHMFQSIKHMFRHIN